MTKTGRRPRVYVVNRAGHDYSDAERYGDLVFVTEGKLRYFATTNHTRTWVEALKDSSPEDMIILSALNVVCGIGCAIFARMHGRLNFLLFRRDRYILRELDLSHIPQAEKEDYSDGSAPTDPSPDATDDLQ